MGVIHRQYNPAHDFSSISDFLIRNYQTNNQDGNWLQPAWEYMHHHSFLDRPTLGRVGIWDDNGEIVAVVHHEWRLGEAFFQVKPGYESLKEAMLDYAETNLAGTAEDGKPIIKAYVNDNDQHLQSILKARNYRILMEEARPIAQFQIQDMNPVVKVPPGYHIISLADENDLVKINRVLWRGFNHLGEPDEDLEGRRIIQSSPHFRNDLTMVVKAPDGQYAAFAGTWYDPINRYAYIEPVATDPDYRRLGLGKAAVMEGIRRCSLEGATMAYVGSDQPFYLAMGFKVLFASDCWVKVLA